MPLLKALIQGFIFCLHPQALNNLWGRYDPKTWKFQDLIVLIVSVLYWLVFENQTNQHMFTVNVQVKVNLESFNSFLQL